MKKKSIMGFTMIELMVTSALGLLLTASLMGLLSLGRLVWQDADAKTGGVQEVRKGLMQLSLDLPRASWSSPATADCGSGITFGAGGSSICFRVPQTILGQTITWGDTIRYRVAGTGTQLVRENLTTGETQIAANTISSAAFATLPSPHNTVVTITLNAQNTSLSTRAFQSSLQTNFSVRN